VPLHRQLLAYKQDPSEAEHTRLEVAFDELFAPQAEYEILDECIAKTRAKKQSLLLVLEYSKLPLHNNASKLGIRRRVCKRDVSFPGTARQGRCGPRTEAGRRAWDTFMTLAEATGNWALVFTPIYSTGLPDLTPSYRWQI
jgi:hypothetical protein